MTTIRSNLLLAGATLAGALGVAATAQATTIYGGGASLPAPYFRQAADCWGDKLGLAFRGTATTTTLLDFNYTPASGTPFNCATQTVSPGDAVSYISTGSGRGILGFFAHVGDGPGTAPNARNADNLPAFPPGNLFGNDIDWLGNSSSTNANVAPAAYATKVNFALSEAALGANDLSVTDDNNSATGIYTAGGVVSQSGLSIRVVGPGETPSTDTSGTARAEFPNPRQNYGRPIQVPILIAPVAVAYDPVYKKVADEAGNVTEYSFVIPSSNRREGGGLRLSRTRLCNIFTGVFTNWNQLSSTSTTVVSKASADPAPFDVPLQIVGRSDGSGTTSIWTRHLSAVCGTGVYTNSTTTLPTSLRNVFPGTPVTNGGGIYNKNLANDPAPNEVLGRYTIADGNDGVAKYLDFTRVPAAGQTIVQGRMGYVGTDYVLPYVNVTAQNEFGLNTANVQNADSQYIAPTPAGALAAFTGLRAPDSTSSGGFSSSAAGDRRDPSASTGTAWVQASDRASPLANPNPSGTTAQYPIVGTTNALIYQCYADADEAAVVRGFFDWYYSALTVNSSSAGILTRAGFSPLPLAFRTAIRETFITDPSSIPYELEIRPVGEQGCASVTTGA